MATSTNTNTNANIPADVAAEPDAAPSDVATPEKKTAELAPDWKPEAILHDVSDEKRRAQADSGVTSAYWQAFALITSGRTLEQTAEVLQRSQRTVRQWHYTVSLAVAISGGVPEETDDGLPPARLAGFIPSAETAIRPILRATAKDSNDQTTLLAVVAHAAKIRASQMLGAAAAVAALEGTGLPTEEQQTDYVDRIVPAQVADAVATRAKEISEAKAKAAEEQQRKEAEAAAQAKAKAQTPEEKAREEAQQRKARAAAVDTYAAELASGPVHEWLSATTLLIERFRARVTLGLQNGKPVTLTPEQIEQVEQLAAWLSESATMVRNKAPLPPKRPTPARRK